MSPLRRESRNAGAGPAPAGRRSRPPCVTPQGWTLPGVRAHRREVVTQSTWRPRPALRELLPHHIGDAAAEAGVDLSKSSSRPGRQPASTLFSTSIARGQLAAGRRRARGAHVLAGLVDQPELDTIAAARAHAGEALHRAPRTARAPSRHAQLALHLAPEAIGGRRALVDSAAPAVSGSAPRGGRSALLPPGPPSCGRAVQLGRRRPRGRRGRLPTLSPYFRLSRVSASRRRRSPRAARRNDRRPEPPDLGDGLLGVRGGRLEVRAGAPKLRSSRWRVGQDARHARAGSWRPRVRRRATAAASVRPLVKRSPCWSRRRSARSPSSRPREPGCVDLGGLERRRSSRWARSRSAPRVRSTASRAACRLAKRVATVSRNPSASAKPVQEVELVRRPRAAGSCWPWTSRRDRRHAPAARRDRRIVTNARGGPSARARGE